MSFKIKFDKDLARSLKKYSKLLIIVLTPIITAIIPLAITTKSAKCAYVVILMAVFWLTDALPVGITSLFPVIFFPLLGIMPSDKVTIGYFKDIVMLFYGGLVVANAIEISKLHERIALKVLLFFGSDPKWLMLGFMLITAFLSLWISNTASTAMMLPVVDAVVKQLLKVDKVYQKKDYAAVNAAYEAEIESEGNSQKGIKLNVVIKSENDIGNCDAEKARRLLSGFLLSCAYSASIGGLGSLVGTPPNVLVKGYFDRFYPEAKLNFLTFTLYALPVSFIMICVSWVWLTYRWLPKEYLFSFRKKQTDNEETSRSLKVVLVKKYTDLGPATWEQKCVSVVFIVLIFLWVTRDLHAVPGWGYFFKKGYVSDATPAVLALIVLFICPKENIFIGKKYEHLVDWKTLQQTFPWSIILLIGGGLVMASGFQESGLSDWIGLQLKSLAGGHKQVLLIFIIIISASATEFTSNTSIASIFIPIIDAMAIESGISPIFLILPLILSVSLAFMLPIASPNNAMVFASGNLKMKDMVTTGVLMNLIGFVVIYIASNTWLGLIFDLNLTRQTSRNVTVTISSND